MQSLGGDGAVLEVPGECGFLGRRCPGCGPFLHLQSEARHPPISASVATSFSLTLTPVPLIRTLVATLSRLTSPSLSPRNPASPISRSLPPSASPCATRSHSHMWGWDGASLRGLLSRPWRRVLWLFHSHWRDAHTESQRGSHTPCSPRDQAARTDLRPWAFCQHLPTSSAGAIPARVWGGRRGGEGR